MKPIMNNDIETAIRKCSLDIASPFYFYDTNSIKQMCQTFNALPIDNKSVHFACMANSSPHFLKIILHEKLNVFVNSIGHLSDVLSVGFKPEQVIFAASAMDTHTMIAVYEKNVLSILDSLGQIGQWKALFPATSFGVRCNIGEFVKPQKTIGGYFIGTNSRLGLLPEEITQIKGDQQVSGLHIYVGTDICNLEYFEDCYKALSQYISFFPNLEFIDFGGGFGMSADPHYEFDFDRYSRMVSAIMTKIRSTHPGIRMIIEPGRIIGGRSAWYVCKVTDVKHRNGKQLIGVNGSSVQFPRPLFYPDSAQHPVRILKSNERSNNHKDILSSVYGCSTYSRDFLAQDVFLPQAKVDDILTIGDAGSYCAAAYTNFLGFPPAKEIFYDSKTHKKQGREESILHVSRQAI